MSFSVTPAVRRHGATPVTPAAKRTASLFGRTGSIGNEDASPWNYPVGVAEHEIGEAFDGRVALEMRYDPIRRRYATCLVVLRPSADPDEWRFGWRGFATAEEAISDWQQDLERLRSEGLSLV